MSSKDTRVDLLAILFPSLQKEELQAAVEEMDEKATEICQCPDYRITS